MKQSISYKPTTAEAKKRFLKGGAPPKKNVEPEDEDPKEEQQTELLEGPFEIVEPIDTVVGPIGKFIMEPQNFPMHPSVILFGKRRTGKTFTLRDIMYNCFRDIPFGICMSGTSYNGFWQEYIPASLVFQGLKPDMMQKVIERQKRMIKRFQKEHPDKDYKMEKSLRAFIVFGKFPSLIFRGKPFYGDCPVFFSSRIFSKVVHHDISYQTRHFLPCYAWTMQLPKCHTRQIDVSSCFFHRTRVFANFKQ